MEPKKSPSAALVPRELVSMLQIQYFGALQEHLIVLEAEWRTTILYVAIDDFLASIYSECEVRTNISVAMTNSGSVHTPSLESMRSMPCIFVVHGRNPRLR